MLVPSRASEGGARAPARSVGALLRASVEARAARRLCIALSAAAIGAEQRGDAVGRGSGGSPCETIIPRVRGATARPRVVAMTVGPPRLFVQAPIGPYEPLRKPLFDCVNATAQQRDLLAEWTALAVREVVRIDAERVSETQAEIEARRRDRPGLNRADCTFGHADDCGEVRNAVPEARAVFANALAHRLHASAAPRRRAWEPHPGASLAVRRSDLLGRSSVAVRVAHPCLGFVAVADRGEGADQGEPQARSRRLVRRLDDDRGPVVGRDGAYAVRPEHGAQDPGASVPSGQHSGRVDVLLGVSDKLGQDEAEGPQGRAGRRIVRITHACELACLQSGGPARFSEGAVMAKGAQAKRAITIRIAEEVANLLEAESIADGRGRGSGRVYSPSATIERILREYFAAKPKRRTK